MPAIDPLFAIGGAPTCAAGESLAATLFQLREYLAGGVKLKSASMTTMSSWSGRRADPG
jgi:hypothetical protein